MRHEIYFQMQRPWSRSRALVALLRDMTLLWLAPGRRLAPGQAAGVLFAATLPGANGWGCLEPAMAVAQAAGLAVASVAHPRLGGRAPALPRPPAVALVRAVAAFLRHLAPQRGMPVSPVLVAAAVARGVAWRAAWRRALAGGRGVVVLHNDFDMMSAAALDQGWPTICLQHGIPTDEFFPARAGLQVVWGQSSAEAYRAAGCDRLAVDALGRAAPPPADQAPPAGIVLVSQSHARVYGSDLADRFRALAKALPPETRVLLHPGECPDRHCYHGLKHLRLERPPHAMLQQAQPKHLVVGFCSTALLDAARAGHDVIGLDWPAAGSAAARAIAMPPRQVADAAAVVATFRRLTDDPQERAVFAADRVAWLARSFTAAAGGFVAALRQELER